MPDRKIDYTRPAKEILWQCLGAATGHILKRKGLFLTPDEYYDLSMDIQVTAHRRLMNNLDKWDRRYEFSTFVYWYVWSVSGRSVDDFLKKKKFVHEQVSSMDDSPVELSNVDRLDYISRKEMKNIRANKHAYNKETREDRYFDYLGYCEESGVEPVSFAAFCGQSGGNGLFGVTP